MKDLVLVVHDVEITFGVFVARSKTKMVFFGFWKLSQQTAEQWIETPQFEQFVLSHPLLEQHVYVYSTYKHRIRRNFKLLQIESR